MDLARRFVEMESPTADKNHVDAFGAYVAEEFRALGTEIEVISQTTAGNHLCFNLVPPAAATETGPILILGHLDTVWRFGEITKRPFRIEGGRAYGPGLFDMKMSLALLHMIQQALRDGRLRPRRAIRVLITSDEEEGSLTSRALIEKEAADCHFVLVLEPPLPDYRVKTMRKGVGRFHIAVKGRSAHAGIDHEKGVNAIEELSHQIITLQSLTDYGRGITINVGVVSGGTVPNVVPAEAEAVVDVRVSALTDGEEIAKRIFGLKPAHTGAMLTITGGMNRPPLVRTPAIVHLYEKARDLAQEIGLSLGEGATGGGSDGCFTAALGIPTLDGLGVDGRGAHALDEHIVVADIPYKATLLARLIETL